MKDNADDLHVTVTPAAHHWQASVRLVLQIRTPQYFVLLSYGDGTTAIHRAVDEQGTVGGDWWGTVQAASLEGCLTRFAEEHGISLNALCAAVVGSLEATALIQSQRASAPPEGDVSHSSEHSDAED